MRSLRYKLVLLAILAAALLFTPHSVRADSYTEELMNLLNEYPVSEEELDYVNAEGDLTDEENAPATLNLPPEEETDEAWTESEEEETESDPQFLTKRLLVLDGMPADTFGAVAVVSKNDAQYILQYETEGEARDAYEALLAAGCQVTPDEVIQVSFDSVAPTKKTNTNSYGPSLMGLDYLAGTLNQTGKGSQVVVATIDTGVDRSSSYLSGRLMSGYHIFTNNGYTYQINSDVSDGHGHGTNLAGIIAESTSDNVRIFPIKAFTDSGSSTVTAIDLGICLASEYADVINMSFTYHSDNAKSETFLNSSLDAALADGDIICCAAGNENQALKYSYPSCYEPLWSIGSVNSSKTRSSFSNHGKLLDFVAPGEGVTVLDLNDKLLAGSGTSYSSPFVAAAAAMFKSLGYQSDEIYDMFCSLSDDLGTSGRDNYYGYGLLTLTKENVCACGQALCPVILMDGEECDCGVCKITKSVNISKATVSKIGPRAYTGNPRKPAVTVTYDGRTLTRGRHYSVSYKNNTKIGSATIVIKGKGSYTGRKTVHFKIRPHRGTIKKLIRRSSTSFQVNIKSIKGTKKYRIRYSVNKNMSHSKKLNTTNRKQVIKGLKKGQTYYVQVRGYKKVNKKTYYGRWSKKVKITL